MSERSGRDGARNRIATTQLCGAVSSVPQKRVQPKSAQALGPCQEMMDITRDLLTSGIQCPTLVNNTQ